MTARPIVILDTTGPTLDVPQGTDTYLAETDLAITGDVDLAGVLFLTEQAAAEADVAGKGQLWVKTATPNQLWFTDDAGTDVQLGTSGTEPFYGTIYIETVANQDYELSFDMPFAGTVTTLRTKSQAGTCTVTGKVNTTALGGTANSASSVASEQAHASANTWSKGDTLKVTISANSACTDLEIAWIGTVS